MDFPRIYMKKAADNSHICQISFFSSRNRTDIGLLLNKTA
jgi:hypothetical protein